LALHRVKWTTHALTGYVKVYNHGSLFMSSTSRNGKHVCHILPLSTVTVVLALHLDV
jgi:hypothetical protein